MKKYSIWLLIGFLLSPGSINGALLGKGMMCSLINNPRERNFADLVVYFNLDSEVELNRIYRQIDTFQFMKSPEKTSKLETDANEIRWVCTTGCPSEVYGNYVLNRQNLNLKSAAENFKCVVLNSFEELEKSFIERVLELQNEYNSALEGNKI